MAQSIESQCSGILDLVKMWPDKDTWPYLKPVKKVEQLFLEFTEMLVQSKDMIADKDLKKWFCRLNMFRWCLELHNTTSEFSGLITKVNQCAEVVRQRMDPPDDVIAKPIAPTKKSEVTLKIEDFTLVPKGPV